MDLVQIVEAIIFAAPEPVTAQDVARALRRTAKAVLAAEAEAAAIAAEAGVDTEDPPPPEKKSRAKKKKSQEPKETDPEVLVKVSAKQIYGLIDEINETYNATGRPMHLVEGPTGWRFYTRVDYAPYIRSLLPDVKPERFSGPAMETLAIIAYRQPITKADIEAVRGVSVDGVLNKIIDKGLVKIGGRAELPGKPLLYETTETFLEHFGIKNVEDLPNSSELRRVELPSADVSEEDGVEADEQLSLGANTETAKAEDAAEEIEGDVKAEGEEQSEADASETSEGDDDTEGEGSVAETEVEADSEEESGEGAEGVLVNQEEE
ncbi:MAG: SMC-Scp complex subunit ScpB [Verrucomicrobia bacterium]|nr:SMC-Scp complex subunit ScpB [Verrucomicrobiota bacterium]